MRSTFNGTEVLKPSVGPYATTAVVSCMLLGLALSGCGDGTVPLPSDDRSYRVEGSIVGTPDRRSKRLTRFDFKATRTSSTTDRFVTDKGVVSVDLRERRPTLAVGDNLRLDCHARFELNRGIKPPLRSEVADEAAATKQLENQGSWKLAYCYFARN